MIKIERITATKPTLLRNGVRQPVTQNMTVTAAELETIEATDGTILYSVDEMEVKTITFQAKPVAPTPAAKPVAKPVIKQPQPKAAQPTVEPTSEENAPE
jgi:hypothetical protein